MQTKLLFDCVGEVPAEKHQGVRTMAFRVEESPGFVSGSIQISVFKVEAPYGA